MRMVISLSVIILIMTANSVIADPVPTTLNDFFLPGSQPNQSGNLETPDKCDNCHGGYDIEVEPAFNWRGSMMAQAARDPLFYACLAISNQDAPESGDLCIRCHSPAGWLEGRSTPTDGSALNNNDREGVQCDFCHKLVKPTELGVNPFPDDSFYTADTYPRDQTYLATLDSIPGWSANGMYIADSDNAKRGPFVDAAARHQMYYSPFHPEADLCGTCHDVSNPVYARTPGGNYVPNDFDQPSPDFDPYTMFPIERTFSEWKMSEYNTPEGVYAPQFGGNKDTVYTCQDCHMRDVTGLGCNKQGVPERDDLPLHDMTGGNTFIPNLIDALFPGEPDPAALDSGIVRAGYMLHNAASMNLSAEQQENNHELEVNIVNETGHKLPSGYPEGRRIWINVRAYNMYDNLIYESGAYDSTTGELTHDSDAKIYQIKPGISNDLSPIVNLPVGPSFHFVLNDSVFSDNRIPPRGFTNTNFEAIQSPAIGYTYEDGQYWDDTQYMLPGATAKVVVTLYYQTTSKDYVEFLRDENSTNDWGDTFYNLWATNGKSAPEVMVKDSLFLEPLDTNSPPILDPIDPQTVDEGQLLEFRVHATDPDNDSLILSAEDLPVNAVFEDSGNGAGAFTFAPDYDQADIYTVRFIAEDTLSAADTQLVEITVNNINRPPALDSIDPQSVDEGQLLVFRVHATDPDNDSLILSAEDLPVNAVFEDSGNGAGAFTFAPDYDQADIYTVRFIAEDTLSAADTQLVEITVNNINRPPALDPIDPQSVDEGQLLEFRIHATDPDNDSLILSAEDLPVNAVFEDSGNGAGAFTFAPDYDQANIYTVRFIAEDTLSAADTQLVEITVNNVENNPPVLDPIDPQSVDEGQILEFRIHATDPDNDSLILSAEDLPVNAVFEDSGNGAGAFTFAPDYDQADVYTVRFIAEDTLSAADTQLVEITVNNVNRPPALDPIDPQSVDEGQLLEFRVHATDPDNDSLILSAEDLPVNAVFEDSGNGAGAFTFAPDYDQADIYTVRFIAEDTPSAADTQLVEITVNNVNVPPILDPIGDQFGAPDELLTFIVTAIDQDDDIVELSAENIPYGATFSDDGWDEDLQKYRGTFEWTPDISQIGIYVNVRFIAHDGLDIDDEYITITISGSECTYEPGDVNHNGSPNELADVIAMSNIYRGNIDPYYTCNCPPHGAEFAADADPSGNCVPAELSDVVTEISAYRGTATPSGCPDCPGTLILSPEDGRGTTTIVPDEPGIRDAETRKTPSE
jgi:hypothetical protein